jgi:hypothetical protein
MKLPNVNLVIQLLRSSGVKAVKGLCAQFVITKFIVSVYLILTNSNVLTNYKIELLSPVERLRIVKERMAGIPTDHVDASERYKNMRDLK